jgi:hypothetical protein
MLKITSWFAANVFVVVSLVLPWPAAAQETPRLNDKNLKQLIEDVDHARDRFEDALDGGFKGSIVRGPRGEVRVDKYLDDLQENFKRLKERYTSDYSASQEALTVLRQGGDVGEFMKAQPDSMKGQSEWDRLAVSLKTLAAAYATTFPVPPAGTARRINDREAASMAETAASQAQGFKNAVNKDKTIPKPQKDALKRQADELAKLCKTVKSRLSGGNPATAEARQMFDATARLGEAAAASGASPTTLAPLGSLRSSMLNLQQAYGMIPPPAQ